MVQRRSSAAGRPDRHRPNTGPRGDVADGEAVERPGGNLLQAEHVGIVARSRAAIISSQERLPLRRHGVAVKEVPAPDEHAHYATSVRVLLADPPAFTPWYDHELAARARGCGRRRRAGDVALSLRRAARPRTATAAASASTRCRRASSGARALRLPLKAVEHLGVLGVARGGATRRAAPAVARAAAARRARCASARRRSSLRTTCCRGAPRRDASCGSSCSRKFDRVVVHTERGRETLAELGIDAHVIPHPVYPSAAHARRRRAHAARARHDPRRTRDCPTRSR